MLKNETPSQDTAVVFSRLGVLDESWRSRDTLLGMPLSNLLLGRWHKTAITPVTSWFHKYTAKFHQRFLSSMSPAITPEESSDCISAELNFIRDPYLQGLLAMCARVPRNQIWLHSKMMAFGFVVKIRISYRTSSTCRDRLILGWDFWIRQDNHELIYFNQKREKIQLMPYTLI